MIVIYIMYYQGLTMMTCTCQVCKFGPNYDNTTDKKALYHRKQHLKAVRNFNPEDHEPVPVTRTNTPIHPLFAPPTGTSVHSSGTTGTFVLPTGTFVLPTGTYAPPVGTAGTTETSAPPAETDETSAHPTGTF